MNVLFRTEPLDAGAWMRWVGAGLFVFVAVELKKFVFRRPRSDTAAAEDTEPRSKKRNGWRRPERRTLAQFEQKSEQREQDAR